MWAVNVWTILRESNQESAISFQVNGPFSIYYYQNCLIWSNSLPRARTLSCLRLQTMYHVTFYNWNFWSTATDSCIFSLPYTVLNAGELLNKISNGYFYNLHYHDYRQNIITMMVIIYKQIWCRCFLISIHLKKVYKLRVSLSKMSLQERYITRAN